MFDYDGKWQRLQVVNLELENPDLWNDPEQAQAISKEKKSLDDVVLVLDELKQNLQDSQELLELIIDENDEEAFAALEKSVKEYTKIIEDFEFRRMFSNPADPLNCFLDIQAGAGGT
ncbi:MAG: PCRF domain-containing protein, partial [Alcaligenaceae bacterium]|nr:PCRF domain-containing protein [Alcaligenaceae bacterium]